jgi:outer membrane lipoprotein carrier protein
MASRFFRVAGRSAAALFLLCAGTASAGQGPARLDRFLGGLQTLSARFEQEVEQAEIPDTQRSAGSLAIRRPGQFRWDYVEPYEQLVLADGQTIWLYDPDLAQVTRQEQAQALEGTPAQVLSDARPLTGSFTVLDAGEAEGLAWVELVPRDPDSQFERIRLGLDESGLRALEMADKLGQHTRFRFYEVKRNPLLADGLFQFEPPPGVDVLEH